jgi:cyclic dehypoxanthinyl futalosine synthase
VSADPEWIETLRARLLAGGRADIAEAGRLFTEASDDQLQALAALVRGRYHAPGVATYLVMAIINTTNVCVARCDYCAFYKLPGQQGSYLLSYEQLCERIDALRSLGGTLVGFNGGFHPDIRIEDYAELFAKLRARYAADAIEFYEMTVAEFMFVTKRTGLPYAEGARRFAAAGTRWITGGGAEILADSFRLRHSPAKYKVEDYLSAQRAILDAGLGSTATMVIGFDESLAERLSHIERLRRFQDEVNGRLSSFLCWTYKPYHTAAGGQEVSTAEYLRWLAVCRIYLDNIRHLRTSVLTRNADALLGLAYGANDFDLPTEDEVTTKAGATISHDFEALLDSARALGFTVTRRAPFAPGGAAA